YLDEKDILEIVAKYSPINFHELRFFYIIGGKSKLLPNELESFFISWMNSKSKIPFTFILVNCKWAYAFTDNDENMKIIEKYNKLGIVRFKIISDYHDDF